MSPISHHRTPHRRHELAADRALAADPFGPRAASCCETLRRRARRHAARGEYRKATVVLRSLVSARGDAVHWVLLGDMLRRASRPDEAREALKQGLWLHRQAGASLRAATVAQLIERLDGASVPRPWQRREGSGLALSAR